MKRKIKTLTATFLVMCMLAASGCGNSDDSGSVGLGRRTDGSGGSNQTTVDIFGGDNTTQTVPTTQSTPTTEYTTQDVPTTQSTPTTEYTTQNVPTTESTTQQTTSGGIKTTRIENDYYKVTLPDGWKFETWGAGSGFCFRCTNPQDPSMVILYAGTLYPIFTNEQQKTPYYSVPGCEVYTDAPVFNDQTVDSIYQNWEYIVNFQIKYQGFSLFPVITNVTPQGSQVTNDMMNQFNPNFTDSLGYAYGTSENGTSVISLTKASIGGDPMDLFAVGYDNSPRQIALFYSVECPQDKSDLVQTMMDCALSLEFTEKALQEQQEALNGTGGSIGQAGGISTEEENPLDKIPTYEIPLPDGKTTIDYPF